MSLIRRLCVLAAVEPREAVAADQHPFPLTMPLAFYVSIGGCPEDARRWQRAKLVEQSKIDKIHRERSRACTGCPHTSPRPAWAVLLTDLYPADKLTL